MVFTWLNFKIWEEVTAGEEYFLLKNSNFHEKKK